MHMKFGDPPHKRVSKFGDPPHYHVRPPSPVVNDMSLNKMTSSGWPLKIPLTQNFTTKNTPTPPPLSVCMGSHPLGNYPTQNSNPSGSINFWEKQVFALGTSHYLWPGGGDRSQMTFCRKYFRGPLDARREKFAAHSASRKNFSMPTLIGRPKHVL